MSGGKGKRVLFGLEVRGFGQQSVCSDVMANDVTDLLVLDSEEEGLLEILLAAAEDAGNLVALMGEEGPTPAPADNLSQREQLRLHLRPSPQHLRLHPLPL